LNGEILDHLGDFTFAKKLVVDGAKFAIVCQSGGGGGTPIMWKRFSKIEY